MEKIEQLKREIELLEREKKVLVHEREELQKRVEKLCKKISIVSNYSVCRTDVCPKGFNGKTTQCNAECIDPSEWEEWAKNNVD